HDDLFSGALVLITPTPQSDEAALVRTEQFWQALGSRTRRLDAATHDRLLAQTSHLPHRIAAGDPRLWQEIFLTNRDELLAALDRFQAVLGEMKAALVAGDEAAVREL